MYAKLEEVVLIHPTKYRKIEGREDSSIYERGLNGDRVFTFDPVPSRYDTAAPKRYGVAYEGPQDRLCIVPDAWSDDVAMCAHSAVWPDLPREEITEPSIEEEE